MELLNEEAWKRWVDYRSAIKKPIKDVSLEPMKLKLLRMGDHDTQSKIVDQSIANQWQGLFELKAPSTERYDPHAPKKRSPEQQKAADASFEASLKANEWGWKKDQKADPIFTELLLAEALLNRYLLEQEGELRTEKINSLKGAVADRLRVIDPERVLKNLHLYRMVLFLFTDSAPKGAWGIRRLEQRLQLEAA